MKTCWVCGSSDILPWKSRNFNRPVTSEDLRITDKRYGLTLALLICKSCSFIFSEDAEADELQALYSKLKDTGYVESLEGRALQMKWLLDTALSLRPDALSLLDIGAGVGLLVQEATMRGIRAVGVEPSEFLVRIGCEQLGIELLQGLFPHPSLAGQHFDLVFLVDVIEHVARPMALLRNCGDALSLNGILLVVTPDVSSLATRIFGKRWWHFRLAHVGYFNRRSLAIAARNAGLQPLCFFRARWFFHLGYLAERLSTYLPIGRLNAVAEKNSVVRWIYSRKLAVNLLDSWVVVMSRSIGG